MSGKKLCAAGYGFDIIMRCAASFMVSTLMPSSRRFAQCSLAERAYQFIRERVLRGVLPLGATLSRRELASELGMSLVPVSEALQRLESEGLVETKPRARRRYRIKDR